MGIALITGIIVTAVFYLGRVFERDFAPRKAPPSADPQYVRIVSEDYASWAFGGGNWYHLRYKASARVAADVTGQADNWRWDAYDRKGGRVGNGGNATSLNEAYMKAENALMGFPHGHA